MDLFQAFSRRDNSLPEFEANPLACKFTQSSAMFIYPKEVFFLCLSFHKLNFRLASIWKKFNPLLEVIFPEEKFSIFLILRIIIPIK